MDQIFLEINKRACAAPVLGSFECHVPLKASEAVQNSAKKIAFRRTVCSPLTLLSKQQQQKIVLVLLSLKKTLRQALSSDTGNLAVLQRTENETFALVNALIEG